MFVIFTVSQEPRAPNDTGSIDASAQGTPMKGFIEDIEEPTEGNKDFRSVLYTGKPATGADGLEARRGDR